MNRIPSSRLKLGFLAAVFVCACSLLLTTLIAWKTRSTIEATAGREFDLVCDEIRNNIQARLATNAQILRGGAALFNATGTVSRETWRTFSQGLQLEHNFPGIQGVGFSVLVPAAGLEGHVGIIRAEGFPEYSVFPAGVRPVYSSIIYLEPFTERNLRAFGFDMFSEPVRRAAMEQARDNNKPALSGKVVLMQETKDGIQAGTLLYVPVYRQGEPVETVEQRRNAIIGWVYSPYRMTDLMRGTLYHGETGVNGRNMHLQVFDGDSLSPLNLLFDSRGNEAVELDPGESAQRVVTLETAGRLWTLRFVQPGGLNAEADFSSIRYIFIGGSVISLLLSGLMLAMFLTRERARRMAQNLTVELKESESRLREVLENSVDASYKRKLGSNAYEYLSPVFQDLTGYAPAEFINLPLEAVQMLVHPEDQAAVTSLLSGAMLCEDRAACHAEYRFRHKDGQYRWFHDQFTVVCNAQGQPSVLIGSVHDISDRKISEENECSVRQRMESIIEGTNVGTWEWDIQTGVLELNEKWAGILGYSLEELGPVGIHTWKRFAHPDDFKASLEVLERHFSGELPYYDIECRMKHRDGRWIWVQARGCVLTRTGEGKPLMMYGTHTDIAERKNAEALISSTLEENRHLLAELQHRVKNSFSMISSMIHLSAQAQDIPESKATLADLDSRVRAVAGLYSLLYSSDSFTEARLDDYCSRIAGSLIGLSSAIALKLELEKIIVPVKAAASFGLIVSELIMNALKYAFPEGRSGTVSLSLRKTPSGVRFELADDGIGLPAGFEPSSSTGMGYSLVYGLTDQIRGSFRVERGMPGTICVLEFPDG